MREAGRTRVDSGQAGADDRGQLSLPLVEAAVGTLLVLTVVLGFGLGVPDPGTRRAQLDTYAGDAAAVLAADPPAGTGASRLSVASRSTEGFVGERAPLAARIEALLPKNVLYRVETPAGTLGYPRPAGRPVGRATTQTRHGPVVLEVWYA
jgi:hypothetical protein